MWASGAIAGAESILAARGITPGSSIYQGALVDAAMKAGIPIAQADAQLNARFQELNLNNRQQAEVVNANNLLNCLLYTSPSPRDGLLSRMPSSA